MSTKPARERTAQATAEPKSLETFDSEAVEAARIERDKFKDIAQRAQADLVNFRRRVTTERDADRQRTKVRLGLLMIEVADQLENALGEYAPDDLSSTWVAGVKAVYDKFIRSLNSEGFERYEALGQLFDPLLHEALATTSTATIAADTVTRQIKAGYKYNGEVVRPAQVEIVAQPATDKINTNQNKE